jgi:quinol monooxygenase YgiN
MAHVTYFRFKAKPGERQAVVDSFQRWTQERGPKVKGFLRSVLTSGLEDPNEFIAAAMFDTTENYSANSNDPEQGGWYEELRSHLAADPDWFNGKLESLIDA